MITSKQRYEEMKQEKVIQQAIEYKLRDFANYNWTPTKNETLVIGLGLREGDKVEDIENLVNEYKKQGWNANMTVNWNNATVEINMW